MISLVIFILVAYGASNIMVFGSIFAKFREMIGVNKENPNFFGKLFGCMMCLPFWWGIILSITLFSPTLNLDLLQSYDFFGENPINKSILCSFFDGCLASGAVWLLHTLQEKLEK